MPVTAIVSFEKVNNKDGAWQGYQYHGTDEVSINVSLDHADLTK